MTPGIAETLRHLQATRARMLAKIYQQINLHEDVATLALLVTKADGQLHAITRAEDLVKMYAAQAGYEILEGKE